MEKKTRIILVGGFLGSGKTTLLWNVANKLTDRKEKVAMITNDQASALVDTGLLARTGMKTTEVSGSCFCCNFPGFQEAIESLLPEVEGGVILAEPVGSCTDLSATIVQTLKDKLSDRLVISPLSVLADPDKLSDILAGGYAGLHPSSAYIVKKQMEEADYILINKIDSMDPEALDALKQKTVQAFPNAKVMAISGLKDEGVDQWLSAICGDDATGTHLAEVDYDIYAEGEAVLGWLNTTLKLSSSGSTDWASLGREILDRFSALCQEKSAGIGHVKLMIEGPDTFVSGNLTAGPDSVYVQGNSGPDPEVTLTFNARVEMSPEDLQTMALDLINEVCSGKASTEVQVVNSLMPGRPDPTYRYSEVI